VAAKHYIRHCRCGGGAVEEDDARQNGNQRNSRMRQYLPLSGSRTIVPVPN
jgi:hypothetical protein